MFQIPSLINFSFFFKPFELLDVAHTHDIRPIFFSFSPQKTAIIPSQAHKFLLLNKYNSIEKTYVTVKNNDLIANYEELALLLMAIKNIGTTNKYKPIIYTLNDKKEKIEMPDNIYRFLHKVKEASVLFIEIKIGLHKTPFKFIIKDDTHNVIVETKIYHPDELSSETILKSLSHRINKEAKLLSFAQYKYHKNHHIFLDQSFRPHTF